MKEITLVSYPTSTDFDNIDTIRHIKYLKAPPFSILVVTALFRRLGVEVTLFSTDNEYRQHLGAGKKAATFCRDFGGRLAETAGSVVGFSSICNSYYITLAIAKELKRRRPDIKILLGGPHATATARATMEQCWYVDFILVGEIEELLKAFVAHHESSPDKVSGLYWRDSGDSIHCNPVAPPPVLDDIPQPAYDLCEDYTLDSFMVEAGRGCPFLCKFCSTSNFFGKSYRLRPFDAIAQDASVLDRQFGFSKIALLHDNLFHSRQTLVEFCRNWKNDERTRDLSWNCSLRADSITHETAEELGKSGCESVFIGIESGSQRMQRIINKRLKIDRARQVIDSLHANGVRTTVAFMIGFPEEKVDDARLTLNFYYEMLCRKQAAPQIDMLSPVNGSHYYEEYREQLYYDELTSAMAHQGDALSNVSADYDDMVRDFPVLFAAHYALPLQYLDREFVFECACFLRYAAYNLRWLLVMAVYSVGDLYSLVEMFLEYKKNGSSALKGIRYYSNYDFLEDFLDFAASLPERKGFREECLDHYSFMLDAYSLSDEQFDSLRELAAARDDEVPSSLTVDDRLVPTCLTRKARYSFSEFVDAFDNGDPVETVMPKSAAIVLRTDGEQIVMEGVSVLTAAIVRSFDKGQVISAALERLCENKAGLLPDSISNRQQGFLYAIQKLVEIGYLKPDVKTKGSKAA